MPPQRIAYSPGDQGSPGRDEGDPARAVPDEAPADQAGGPGQYRDKMSRLQSQAAGSPSGERFEITVSLGLGGELVGEGFDGVSDDVLGVS